MENKLLLTAFATLLTASGVYASSRTSQPDFQRANAATFRTAITNYALQKAPQRISATDPMITEAPEGEARVYKVDAYGFSVMGFDAAFDRQQGMASEVVEGTDGFWYIKNPISGMQTHSYLKCSREGNKLTAALPQLIYSQDDFFGTTEYYAAILAADEQPDGSVRYNLTDATEVTYTISDDGTITLDMQYDPAVDSEGNINIPQQIFGAVQPDESWAGIGDACQSLTLFTDELVTPPAGKTERWAMTADGIGKMVDVLVADNSIYIKGVSIDFPDAWIKGDINGDKVSFTSNQYMGQLKDNFIYMMASYNVPGETWELRDEMVFDYDADAKTLTSAPTDFMLINASQAYIYFSEMYVAPKFFMQTGEIDPQPLNPVIYSFTDRLSTEGYSWLDFTLSNINADDKVLDPANLYYEIRLDGKVATFNQMDYMFMPEYEMSQFPYEYTDGFDFIIDGSTRKIYFYRNDFETIGLQLFNVVNGEKYASDIVTYNILTGETTIESDSAEEIEAIDGIVISENYYDLNGREVVNPENGIYLRKVTYNNGTSKVFKAVKR